MPLPTPVGNDAVAAMAFPLVVLALVGWLDKPDIEDPPNNESENEEPDAALIPVGEVAAAPAGFALENANDDATLPISVPPGFNALFPKLNPLV